MVQNLAVRMSKLAGISEVTVAWRTPMVVPLDKLRETKMASEQQGGGGETG